MPCYHGYDNNGNGMFLCGDLGPACAECADVSENLCDFPIGKGKTCDRKLCHQHSNEIGPNLHYCTAHFKQWLKFENSGGVQSVLENVVPYKPEVR